YVGEAFLGAVDGFDVERDQESVVVIGQSDVTIAAPAPVVEPAPAIEQAPVAEPVFERAQAANIAAEDIPVSATQTVQPETPEHFTASDAPVDAPDETFAPLDIAHAPVEDAAPDIEDTAFDTPPADDPVDEPMFRSAANTVENAVEPDDVDADDVETADDVAPHDISEQDAAPVFASRLRADRNEGRPTPPPAVPAAKTPPSREEPTFRRQQPSSLAVPTGNGTDPMPSLSAPSRTAHAAPAAPVAPPVTPQTPDADVAPPVTGDTPTALSSDAVLAAASLNAIPADADTPQNDDTTAPAAPVADKTSNAAASALGAATAVGGAVSGMFASRRMARADAAANVEPGEPDDTTDTPKQKARLTVFGARKSPKKREKAVVGGKPRFLGLILTAVLLLFLLALAAFAAMSDENFARWLGFGGDDTQIASPADPSSASEVAALQASNAPDQVTAAPALTAPLAPVGEVLTPEEAARIYAATGVWQRAPRIPLIPRTTTLDGMALANAVTPVVRVPSSPLASASSVAGDALIATPIDPPPPSQTFDFNDDGLVVATPEGAITPDGILVIVGRPPLNPPTRPGTIAPEITPQDQIAAVIPDAAEPVVDAPEGVIVIAGRPAIEPPVRTGTVVPAPTRQSAALAAGDAPLVATEGLLVLAGSPPILPPVRPGTTAITAAPAPEIAAVDPVVDPTLVDPSLVDPVAQLPLAVTPPAPPVEPTTPVETTAPVAPEGVNLIAGAPSILPPVRPGTIAPSAVIEPEIVAVAVAPIAPAVDTATPDILPEGLNLVSGPPPILPPVRPGTVAPQAAVESLTQDIAAALSNTTAQPPSADTRRPLIRPAAVVQAAQAIANAPTVGDLTVAQAAAFRPQTRPAGLAPAPTPDPEPEVAVVEPTPAAPVSLQIAPEIAAAVQAAANRPNPIVNATALAVPQSSRPDTRPRNMARIVERATAAQQRAATQVAAVAPRAVAPSGPTGGSVAQAATLDNAINLRDVNLIGIYGGSGDRRALVRLANGRYLRVTVGDRLDGGRVTAISASALSYSKSGRALTLQVPG
ncbi:MAG: hypothetical protein ACSHWY_04025, partial [Octadecabacter sp.]